jgi:5'-3' exonuclease
MAPPASTPDLSLLALDSASLYYRSYYALPTSMTAPDGHPHNALRGFLSTVARLVEVHRPAGLVAAWDEDWRPQWRVDLLTSYKAHRVAEDGPLEADGVSDAEEEPEDLGPQVSAISMVLDALGIPRWGVAEHEADDVLGSLAADRRRWPGPSGRCLVVTGDRDLVQVIDEHTSVLLTVSGGMEKWPVLDPAAAQERFGVPATRYVDMAVLRGDPSDGLPGVPGVGAKTAVALVSAFGSLDDVVAAAESSAGRPMTPRIAERIRMRTDELVRARAVSTVVRDLDLPSRVPALGELITDEDRLRSLATEWGVTRQVDDLRHALALT